MRVHVCPRCARCHFVSFSRARSFCLWFTHCPLPLQPTLIVANEDGLRFTTMDDVLTVQVVRELHAEGERQQLPVWRVHEKATDSATDGARAH